MVESSDTQPLTCLQEPRADSAGGETGPRGAKTPGKATPQPGSPLPTWLSLHTGGFAGSPPPVLCGDRPRTLRTQAPVGSIEHRLCVQPVDGALRPAWNLPVHASWHLCPHPLFFHHPCPQPPQGQKEGEDQGHGPDWGRILWLLPTSCQL